jgi:hypothetical protein
LRAEAHAAPVKIHVPMQNTAGQYILSWLITQGFLMIRQGAVKNGNWNTTNEPLSNDQISVKK